MSLVQVKIAGGGGNVPLEQQLAIERARALAAEAALASHAARTDNPHAVTAAQAGADPAGTAAAAMSAHEAAADPHPQYLTDVAAPTVIRTTTDLVNAVVHGGLDNTGAVSVSALLPALLASGARIVFPAGTYLFDAPVTATLTKDMWVECHPEAVFACKAPGGGYLGVDGDMIRLKAPTGGVGLPATRKLSVHWEGGYFDQSRQRNSTSEPYTTVYPANGQSGVGVASTAEALSVRGDYSVGGVVKGAFDIIRVHGTRFFSAAHWHELASGSPYGAGGDSHVYANGFDRLDIDTHHTGARDAALYISRDGTGAVGRNVSIRGTFVNCMIGAAVKRGLETSEIAVHADNCVTGVLVSRIIGDLTSSGRISGTFRGCNQGVRLDDCRGIVVSGAKVVDMGATMPDGTAIADTGIRAPVGVLVRGATDCRVTGNLVTGVAAAWAAEPAYGVWLEASSSGTSLRNTIDGNTADGLHGIASEAAGEADWTLIRGNTLTGCDLPGTIINGANTREVRRNTTTGMDEYITHGLMLPDGSSTERALARRGTLGSGMSFDGGDVILGASNVDVIRVAPDGLTPLVKLLRTTAAGLTATGTALGSALLLAADVNEVTTVAAGTGVKLMAVVIGASIVVHNAGANYLRVYPPAGTAIDALAVNVPFPLLPGERVTFDAVGAAQWRSSLAKGARRLVAKVTTKSADVTGTTAETVFSTGTLIVPGNLLGPNGGLVLTALVSGTGVTSRTPKVRWSGAAGSTLYSVASTSLSSRFCVEVHNRAATNSQVAGPNSINGGWGANSGAVQTPAVDTTAESTVVLSGTLSLGTETMALEFAELWAVGA